MAATVLTQYKPWNNEQANLYLNTLGQALSKASDRPETFGGYHFLILDSDEINALSAPGGLVMVTRGMLRCCKTEDQVAAVLAHEITHVACQHGLQAINKERLTSALGTIASEGAKKLGGQQLAQLTEEFGGTVNDVTSSMVNNGYSRKFEGQADAGAVAILQRIGYDPHAMIAMLQQMDRQWQPNGPGFEHTHPSPKDRIAAVSKLIGPSSPPPAPPERLRRFQKALGNV